MAELKDREDLPKVKSMSVRQNPEDGLHLHRSKGQSWGIRSNSAPTRKLREQVTQSIWFISTIDTVHQFARDA